MLVESGVLWVTGCVHGAVLGGAEADGMAAASHCSLCVATPACPVHGPVPGSDVSTPDWTQQYRMTVHSGISLTTGTRVLAVTCPLATQVLTVLSHVQRLIRLFAQWKAEKGDSSHWLSERG